jgi:succinoglycan biosynthesis transport protein ExoP
MPERPPETLVTRTLPRTRELRPEMQQHSSLNISDILSAVFKYKRIILLCTVAGLAAAVAVYYFYPPVYESQAKLLVRYVLERSGVDPIESTHAGGFGQASENILGSEVEILTSWDLAVQAAEAIGPTRLLPHASGTPSKEAAAHSITTGLEVTIHKGSNIIFVAYKNPNPELATVVLNELVSRYFNKHLEVHRSIGAFDFVTQQTDQVRGRLNQTEDALKSLKGKIGIASPLTESAAALSAEAGRIGEQLHMAEAEFAEQQARVLQLGGAPYEPSASASPAADLGDGNDTGPSLMAFGSGKAEKSNKSGQSASSGPEIPSEVLQQYQVLISRLPQLRQAKLDLLSKYTPENQLVKANQTEIDDVTKQCRNLEKKFPDLPSKAAPIGSSSSSGQPDLASETAHLAGIGAKRENLAASFREVQERIKKLSQIAPQIADLERQKELEETNYKYFEATLEKARVDEALDPSKIPNISAVQRPSPPIMVTKARDKLAMGLAGGGLALGLVFALLNEFVLNRTVKRPHELEKLVGINPLLSIPYSKNGRPHSPPQQGGNASALVPKSAKRHNLAPWDAGHFVRAYCEAIRDRIGLYFELNQLTHKPKLVGVTGLSERAGTSTLAAGLAAALSETGDGKVLLVDVNLGPQHVHPFFRGKPAYSLKTALQPASDMSSAAGNLYLATVAPPNAGPAQLGLKKFFDLMPNLKASDFDYIIFDMPPLSETSPTVGIAPFMDKVLLIVEAEKNKRDAVKRGYAALVAGRDNVSVVVNKARSYVPKWLDSKV